WIIQSSRLKKGVFGDKGIMHDNPPNVLFTFIIIILKPTITEYFSIFGNCRHFPLSVSLKENIFVRLSTYYIRSPRGYDYAESE
ncbi:MAG TPA: hypothetical protein VHP38_13150, partial [Ruminiclostridium sp.]|nr:hypothetical protein [Ruminiclostridium sp.]